MSIGNRVYPLTIARDEEEEVRKAASHINDRLKKLEQSFAVTDRTDLLAMLLLEMAVDKGHGKNEVAHERHLAQAQAIIGRLNEALTANSGSLP